MTDRKHNPLHVGDEPHLLREIMRAHQAVLSAFSRKMGIPAARLTLLRFLAVRHPNAVGIMEIARHLGVNAAAVTRQVKTMEAERLIARRPDDKDGRRSHITLTPSGLGHFLQVHERVHAFERAFCTTVSTEDMAAAIHVLTQIRTALETLDEMRHE